MNEERWPLPENWCWAAVSDIGEVVGGGTPKNAKDPSNYAAPGTPWLTPADLTGYTKPYIERGARDLSQRGMRASAARLMPKGTVLFSSRAPIGYCVIAANPISTNQGFKSTIPSKGLLPEYLRYYLLSAKPYAESLASGTTFLELSGARMERLAVPLAPSNEQRRIVAKIDALMARSRAAKEALDAITPLLDHYRQSVLAVAFRGDLTADWREVNAEAAPVEDLQRLGRQRRTPAEDADRGSWPSTELPNTWRWYNFYSVFQDATSSRKKLPQKHYSADGLLPVVDQGNSLIGGYTDRHELCYEGQLPVIVFGDHTRCMKWISTPFVQGADGVKVLAPNAALNSRYCYWALRAVSLPERGYSRHMKFLGASEFPIPPISEQCEIANRLDKDFVCIDNLQNHVEKMITRSADLDRSILAKAFRGELVSQDPNDEPASVLLDRIRAEREAVNADRPKRGRRRA